MTTPVTSGQTWGDATPPVNTGRSDGWLPALEGLRAVAVFAVLVSLTTALAVPIVGAILVLSVTIIPGAAAARVTSNPLKATLLAVAIAEVALLGGTVLSLAPGLSISGYVATIAFIAYLVCRVVGRTRGLVRR